MSYLELSRFIKQGKKAPVDVLERRQKELRRMHRKFESELNHLASEELTTGNVYFAIPQLRSQMNMVEEALKEERADIAFAKYGVKLREIAAVEKINSAAAKKNIKKGIYSEPILKRVQAMPEDIVNTIKEFLPLTTWNELLGQHILTKLTKITNKDDVLRRFYLFIVSRPQSLSLVKRDIAITRVRYLRDGGFNPQYCAKYLARIMQLNVTDLKTSIAFYLNKAKDVSPVFGNQLLKTLTVLTGKQLTWAPFHFASLTEADLPEEK
jgi:hypothetical protein